MGYQTLEFLAFSFITLIVYYACGKKLQKYVLLLANIAFFLFASPVCLIFIIFSTVVAYFGSLSISKLYLKEKTQIAGCDSSEEKKILKQNTKRKAKTILIVSLCLIIGQLVVFKYSVFIIENINVFLRILKIPSIAVFNMILPLGISFYTFMAISYLLDVFWKRYEAEKNFINFSVYLTYFPHVLQGPIDRYNEFKPQISYGVSLQMKNLAFGAQLALWGFFKKLVVADRLNIFVSSIYNQYTEYSGVIFAVATLAYAIQLYADFSGCIDIVSGISEMFGIKLRLNFKHPFFAESVQDYWHRWHISLGEWFKDYVYLPVSSGKLTKRIKKYYRAKGKPGTETILASAIPTVVVWTLTGLWHGASWQYIVWGGYYAVIMVLSNIFSESFQKLTALLKIKTDKFGWKLFRMVRTTCITCLGRVFFRANGVRAALYIIKSMFTCFNPALISGSNLFAYGLDGYCIVLVLFGILVMLVVDIFQEKYSLREVLAEENLLFRWLLIFGCLTVILIYGVYGSDAVINFVYGQF